MIIYLSLLIALIGLLVYAFAASPKLSEIGRICFGLRAARVPAASH